jgi:hypothetical protein
MSEQSPFLEEFNKAKWLMFFETSPLSDHFEKIAFTEKQAKDIGNYVAEVLGSKDGGEFVIHTDDDVEIDVPNAKYTYPPEFFIKEDEEDNSD